MSWKIASLIALVAWSFQGIFGAKATKIHGANASMIFETVAFTVLTIIVMIGATGDLQKITARSALWALIMGMLSAGGFYCMLYAMRVSPEDWPMIIFISGMYPALAVILGHFTGTQLALHQWAGVALAVAGLVLVNWPK